MPEPTYPADEERLTPAEALRWQQRACADLDATLCADLVGHAADHLEGGTDVGALLRDALREAGRLRADGRVRYGDLIGLRLLALAHRAVLSRQAPALAVHYPTVGGRAPRPGPAGDAGRRAARTAFDDVLRADPDRVAAGLRRVPQTNETGRAPLLRHALARLVPPDRPVRLREIGASAGLNLRADRLPGRPELEPPGTVLPPVVDRAGCDLQPLDPATPEGRLTLSSYVWADDVERFARLGAALRVAAEVPATVVRADAASFLAAQRVSAGHALVVWHSAMWPYLEADQRVGVLAAIADLGEAATPDAPVWHVSWEWRPQATHARDWYALVARGWPTGAEVDGGPAPAGSPVLLATGSSHGRVVAAVRPGRRLDDDPVRVSPAR